MHTCFCDAYMLWIVFSRKCFWNYVMFPCMFRNPFWKGFRVFLVYFETSLHCIYFESCFWSMFQNLHSMFRNIIFREVYFETYGSMFRNLISRELCFETSFSRELCFETCNSMFRNFWLYQQIFRNLRCFLLYIFVSI